jgi:hypothetical protein
VEAKVPRPTRTDVSGISQESGYIGGWGLEIGQKPINFWDRNQSETKKRDRNQSFFLERGRTVVDFVLWSEGERNPDELQQFAPPPVAVSHLVKAHVAVVKEVILVGAGEHRDREEISPGEDDAAKDRQVQVTIPIGSR